MQLNLRHADHAIIRAHARVELKQRFEFFQRNPNTDNWGALHDAMSVFQNIVRNTRIAELGTASDMSYTDFAAMTRKQYGKG